MSAPMMDTIERDTVKRSRPLTPRHRQVLSLMVMGRSNRQIAESLGVSPYTVRVYTDRIYLKLGVRTRAEAVRAALVHGSMQTSEKERVA